MIQSPDEQRQMRRHNATAAIYKYSDIAITLQMRGKNQQKHALRMGHYILAADNSIKLF
jgi:hypothetical protein